MWQIIASEPEATLKIGKQLGALLRAGDLVVLIGELGAGKTIFVHGIAQGLGIIDQVSSPSFLILQEYSGKTPLFHADFYRVGCYQELEAIGWEDYLLRHGVVVIEWGNLIPEALPAQRLEVILKPCGLPEEKRELSFRPFGQRYQEIVKELAKRCSFLE